VTCNNALIHAANPPSTAERGDEENESCIPMLDIEGNEFCID